MYVRVSKGWLSDEEITTLLDNLGDSQISCQLIYPKMNALQTFELVFRVSTPELERFRTIVQQTLSEKTKATIINSGR